MTKRSTQTVSFTPEQAEFVRECVDFYHLHPQVGLMIEQDQRRDALAAKHERARAAYDEFVRTMPLEGFAASVLAWFYLLLSGPCWGCP